MRPVDKEAFAARIKARLKKMGWSGARLARELGVAQQTVDNCLNAKVERPRMLNEMAEILWTTPNWLLYAEGPEETSTPVTPEQAIKIINNLNAKDLARAIRYLQGLESSETGVG